jgi:hypothetical protein
MLPRTSGQVTPNDKPPPPPQDTDKTRAAARHAGARQQLTTNQGWPPRRPNSLKSHVRGPALLEDMMREKITHFDQAHSSGSCMPAAPPPTASSGL